MFEKVYVNFEGECTHPCFSLYVIKSRNKQNQFYKQHSLDEIMKKGIKTSFDPNSASISSIYYPILCLWLININLQLFVLLIVRIVS